MNTNHIFSKNFLKNIVTQNMSGKAMVVMFFIVQIISFQLLQGFVYSASASTSTIATKNITVSQVAKDASLARKTGNSRGLENVSYTKRKDRGADEKRRLTARNEYQKILAAQKQFAGTEEDDEPTEAETRRKTATDFVLGAFAGEFTIDRVVKGAGVNALWWPLQYRFQKTKILIHHTADNNAKLPSTVAEEKEYMKNLYRYHAFSRGRGDIGYNFVIMPSGRIYEGRAGGAGVVGAHATWNNTPSVGISLVGNFEEKTPEQAQINSLTNLATAVSKRYNIDPTKETYYFKNSSTFPYIKAEKHQAIAGHKDAGQTKCPGTHLYALLGDIRLAVADRLAGGQGHVAVGGGVMTTTNITPVGGSTSVLSYSSLPITTSTLNPPLQSFSQRKQDYITTNNIKLSTSSTKRLDGAPAITDIATIEKKPIPVLLYDASTTLENWDVSCSSSCVVRIGGRKITASTMKVTKDGTQFAVALGTKIYKVSKFAVSVGGNGTIEIANYTRASGSRKLNTFRQALLFAYGPVKQIDKPIADQHHVINIVSLDNYMKGIGEASDKQSQTKANVLALLAKGYVLYYTAGTLRHTSIPKDALYVITDDPRISQKYSGAGWENLSKKRPVALAQTKGKYIVYKDVLPILPYFHCSAGFTWSAKEKRGWSDTSYAVSVDDIGGKCESGEFEGHGVGLSGDGASALADAGKTEQEIVQYYYPGTEIMSR